jgi:hypothetical protein
VAQTSGSGLRDTARSIGILLGSGVPCLLSAGFLRAALRVVPFRIHSGPRRSPAVTLENTDYHACLVWWDRDVDRELVPDGISERFCG